MSMTQLRRAPPALRCARLEVFDQTTFAPVCRSESTPCPMKSIPPPGVRPPERSQPPHVPPFVTFWRALLGYVAAVTSAASSCFPLADVSRVLRGESPALLRPEMASIDCIRRFLTFE